MSSQQARIALTGSTGALGSQIAKSLTSAPHNVPLRLLARTPAKVPSLPNTTVAQASYSTDAKTVEALKDIDVLFMVSGAEDPKRLQQHYDFVTAAKEAGVRHVVYTSFYGASEKCEFRLGRDHHHTEEFIKKNIPTWTFLRDNFYMDVIPFFGPNILGPAGDGLVSPVAREDVARVITAILADPAKHEGETYDLTGPSDLTFTQIAKILTDANKAAGKTEEFTFTDQTWEEAMASRTKDGTPKWLATAWASTYSAAKLGELRGVSGQVKRLTGKEALSFEEYAKRWASTSS